MASSKKNKDKDKDKNKNKNNKSNLKIFRIIFVLLLIIFFAVCGAVIGLTIGVIKNAPSLDTVELQPDYYTTVIYDDAGNEITKLKGTENRIYVPLEQIPLDLQNAFISLEDYAFYEHGGISIRSIVRATYSNIFKGTNMGASTITQQLIKNNVTHVSHNTIKTKIQEQYLAIRYERTLTREYGSKKAAKDHILEVYLNSIALGHGLYGVQTASSYYFDKDVSELTLSESAVIAAITQNPTKYAPDTHPEENVKRRQSCLDTMLANGLITKAEYDEAMADTEDVYERIAVVTNTNANSTNINSYFVDALIDQVSKDLQEEYDMSEDDAEELIYNGGLQIYSTQNMEMQQIMDEAFLDDSLFPSADYEIDVEYYLTTKDQTTGEESYFGKTFTVQSADMIDAEVARIEEELVAENSVIVSETIIPVPQPQAAMVIIDYHDGSVKAMSGGRGEKMVNRGFNRATDAERQPGSTFKILAAYAPALDLGIVTPATIIIDEPYTITIPGSPPYSPQNWYSGYRGPSTVREGIASSMNILAVKTLMAVGLETSYQYLENFGFTTLVEADKVPSLALGGITNGVTQIELCAAYGAIANGGIYNEPYLYTKVLDKDGNVILEHEPEPKRVLKEETAYLLTDMMEDVVTGANGGTGTKARFSDHNMAIAGKTGTTSDNKDLMFAGYTPYYVASIWMGYDSAKPMSTNNSEHLIIWRTVMEQIHAPLPDKQFTQPDGIVTLQICTDTGLLATEACGDEVYTEIFAAGTEPTTYDYTHSTEVKTDNFFNEAKKKNEENIQTEPPVEVEAELEEEVVELDENGNPLITLPTDDNLVDDNLTDDNDTTNEIINEDNDENSEEDNSENTSPPETSPLEEDVLPTPTPEPTYIPPFSPTPETTVEEAIPVVPEETIPTDEITNNEATQEDTNIDNNAPLID